MRRVAVLIAVLAFIALLAFLTVAAAIKEGVSVGTVLSTLVLVLLTVGIVGALRNPPQA